MADEINSFSSGQLMYVNPSFIVVSKYFPEMREQHVKLGGHEVGSFLSVTVFIVLKVFAS